MQILLNADKFNPNIHDKEGETPLHLAARYDIPTVVGLLLKIDANPNIGNNDRATPLHWAAYYGKTPEVMQKLLDAKADPNARDKDGKRPFDFADRNLHLKDTPVYWTLNDKRFQSD